MYLLQYLNNFNIRKITDKMYLNIREEFCNPLVLCQPLQSPPLQLQLSCTMSPLRSSGLLPATSCSLPASAPSSRSVKYFSSCMMSLILFSSSLLSLLLPAISCPLPASRLFFCQYLLSSSASLSSCPL